MLMENKVKIVVMLTKLKERNEHGKNHSNLDKQFAIGGKRRDTKITHIVSKNMKACTDGPQICYEFVVSNILEPENRGNLQIAKKLS